MRDFSQELIFCHVEIYYLCFCRSFRVAVVSFGSQLADDGSFIVVARTNRENGRVAQTGQSNRCGNGAVDQKQSEEQSHPIHFDAAQPTQTISFWALFVKNDLVLNRCGPTDFIRAHNGTFYSPMRHIFFFPLNIICSIQFACCYTY